MILNLERVREKFDEFNYIIKLVLWWFFFFDDDDDLILIMGWGINI